MIKTVIKRDGSEEPFSHEKLNKLSQWTTDVLTPQEHDIDWSQIALDAVKRLYNNCTTEDIVKALIQSCLDKHEEGYLYAAGKLLISDLYKAIYNSDIPPTLNDFLESMIEKELYEDFLEEYSEEEIIEIDSFIDHSRDFTLTHSQVNQMMSKYLLQDKITKTHFETPQFMFMRIALAVCAEEENRIEKINTVYNLLSHFHLNLPTPMWVNLGTPNKVGTSCLLYAVDDTIGSLNAGDNISYMMTTAGAGIGSVMFTRSAGQPIKKGKLIHAGKIPYFRLLEATIQAAIQGPRGGAATTYINALDPQIETLLHLKNPVSIPEEKVMGIDYAFSYNNFLLQKAKANEEWMLIDYSLAKDLYQAMYDKDEVNFERLYYKYLHDDSVPKKIIKARDLLIRFITESHATGRLYEFNATNANNHTAYLDPILSSNLCITEDQRVVSSEGLLTVKELYELNKELTLFDNKTSVNSSKMKLRGKQEEVYKVTLDNGMDLTATNYHKFPVKGKDNTIIETKLKDLTLSNKVFIQTEKGLFGSLSMESEAFLLGLYQSDGTQYKDTIMLDVWENDFDLIPEIEDKFNYIHKKYGCNLYEVSNQKGPTNKFRSLKTPKFNDCSLNKSSSVLKKRLSSKTLNKALQFQKGFVPDWLWRSTEKTQWSYIRGLLYADGTVFKSESKGNPCQLSYTDTNKNFLKELQILFQNLGLQTSIRLSSKEGLRKLPDGKESYKSYYCKNTYRLIIGNKKDLLEIENNTGFLSRKNVFIENKKYKDNTKKAYKIKSIEYVGKQDVYCPTIKNDEHIFIANGMLTFNCTEIFLPTKAFKHRKELDKNYYKEGDGWVQTCNLAAVNLNKNYSDEEYSELTYWALKIIDFVIDNSFYVLPQIGVTTKNWRSAGVSVINLAHHLAKNSFNYTSVESKKHIHNVFERHEYMLLRASLRIAKERGNAPWIDKTKYPQGYLPIDDYNKNVDSIADFEYLYNWETLRQEIIENKGIAHTSLSTAVPSESSSILSNSTNGLYPVREKVTIKTGVNSKNTTIPPEYEYLNYQFAYDIPTLDLIHMYAIAQKFISQGISADFYFDLTREKDKNTKNLFNLFLARNFYGLKSKYYSNFRTQEGDAQNYMKDDTSNQGTVYFPQTEESEPGCAGGSCTL